MAQYYELEEEVNWDESDDSDVFEPDSYDQSASEQSEDSDEKASRQPRAEFIDSIEHIYITFLSMETKDIMEKLYSVTEIKTRRKWLAHKLAEYGFNVGVSNKKNMMDIKQEKWKQIMASNNMMSFHLHKEKKNQNRV